MSSAASASVAVVSRVSNAGSVTNNSGSSNSTYSSGAPWRPLCCHPRRRSLPPVW